MKRSVYFIVKTALGADTERKRWMAERKLHRTLLQPKGGKAAIRPKTPINPITPNKCRKEAFWSERSHTQFFFHPISHAAIFRPKTATVAQFLLQNSRTQHETSFAKLRWQKVGNDLQKVREWFARCLLSPFLLLLLLHTNAKVEWNKKVLKRENKIEAWKWFISFLSLLHLRPKVKKKPRYE